MPRKKKENIVEEPKVNIITEPHWTPRDKNKRINNVRKHSDDLPICSSINLIDSSFNNQIGERQKTEETSTGKTKRTRKQSKDNPEQLSVFSEGDKPSKSDIRKAVHLPEKPRNDSTSKTDAVTRSKSGSAPVENKTKRIRKTGDEHGVDTTKNVRNSKKDPKPVKRRKDTRAHQTKVNAPVKITCEPLPVKDCWDLVEIILDGVPIQVSATSIQDGYYCQGLDSTFLVRHYFPKGVPTVKKPEIKVMPKKAKKVVDL